MACCVSAFCDRCRCARAKMVVRFMQGEALKKTLAWAESEIEGYMRT